MTFLYPCNIKFQTRIGQHFCIPTASKSQTRVGWHFWVPTVVFAFLQLQNPRPVRQHTASNPSPELSIIFVSLQHQIPVQSWATFLCPYSIKSQSRVGWHFCVPTASNPSPKLGNIYVSQTRVRWHFCVPTESNPSPELGVILASLHSQIPVQSSVTFWCPCSIKSQSKVNGQHFCIKSQTRVRQHFCIPTASNPRPEWGVILASLQHQIPVQS